MSSYKDMKNRVITRSLELISLVDEVTNYIDNLDEVSSKDKSIVRAYAYDIKLKLMNIR